MAKTPLLLTFPRSGVNFAINLLQTTAFKNGVVRRTHNHNRIDNSEVVVGFSRNPFDSITSFVAMQLHFNDPVDIEHFISWYIEIHKVYQSPGSIIFTHDDLRNRPLEVCKYIANHFGNSFNEINLDYFTVPKDGSKYLASSKTSDQYQIAKQMVEEFDLSEAVAAFEKTQELVVRL